MAPILTMIIMLLATKKPHNPNEILLEMNSRLSVCLNRQQHYGNCSLIMVLHAHWKVSESVCNTDSLNLGTGKSSSKSRPSKRKPPESEQAAHKIFSTSVDGRNLSCFRKNGQIELQIMTSRKESHQAADEISSTCQ